MAVGRHGGKNKKLRVHIFKSEHDAEGKLGGRQGFVFSKPIASDTVLQQGHTS